MPKGIGVSTQDLAVGPKLAQVLFEKSKHLPFMLHRVKCQKIDVSRALEDRKGLGFAGGVEPLLRFRERSMPVEIASHDQDGLVDRRQSFDGPELVGGNRQARWELPQQ